MNANRRILWLTVFGAGFGWVEAAIVVYLRGLFYPEGFALPLHPLAPDMLRVELIRELATLAMLIAIGMLAGRTRWGRAAAFGFAFGVWDLVYYLGLKLSLGWPSSLATWDVLFLIPWPWLGPVYAPATVAVLMIVFGARTLCLEMDGRDLYADRATWILALVGVAMLLFTWLHDLDASLGGAMPRPYPVALWVTGIVLLAGAGERFVRLNGSRRREMAP